MPQTSKRPGRYWNKCCPNGKKKHQKPCKSSKKAAVLDYPDRYRRRLRMTNGVERLNEEIRRRERAIRIFPNRESVYRLVGTVLIEINEKWVSGRKYLDMSEY
jgi:transposase-like protein